MLTPPSPPQSICLFIYHTGAASSPSPQRSTIDLQDTQSHLQQTPFPTTQEASRGPGAQEPQENYQLREGISSCQEHLKGMRKTLFRQGYQPDKPHG